MNNINIEQQKMIIKKLIINKFLYLFVGTLLISNSAFTQLDPLTQKDAYVLETITTPVAPEAIAVVRTVKPDPKEPFKDLFEKSGVVTKNASFKNINTAHLNPQAIGFVQDYIRSHADELYELQQTGKPYFDMMDDILTQNGIPKQLKYLAVIESFLKANARSWAGAVGPWQFMPQTARELGLSVSNFRDERQDYLKSTKAASKYLNYLYSIYNDWLLVIAAYNCGPGRVNSAINRCKSNNFWDLQYYLPAESRNHVKKFIATHYIMEGEGGITTVTKTKKAEMLALKNTDNGKTTSMPFPYNNQDLNIQTIAGRYNSKAIAKYLDMPIADFANLNPSLDKVLASNNTYQLRLPKDKVDLFNQKKNEMLNESIQMLINPDYRN